MKRYQTGFSLVELMVAVGVGMTMSLAAAGLVSDMTKANAQVRANLDYVNFVNSVKIELNRATGCTGVIGTQTYVNTADTVVPSINISGSAIPIGGKIPGSQLQLDGITILQTPTAPVNAQLSDMGVLTNFKRNVTRLKIDVSRPNSPPIRPATITLTIFANAATNVVRFCSGSDTTAACVQMGGVFIPGNPAIPTEDRCDILPAFGGCAKGGAYSLTNGSCSAGNPYTSACSCPTAFTPFQIAAFSPSKGADYSQFECLRCSPYVSATNSPAGLLPLYDEDMIENELYCAQNITVCQACQTDPASQTCICGRDPSDPACLTPSACTTYGAGSCPCLAEQQTVACTSAPSSTACSTASGAYFVSCVSF